MVSKWFHCLNFGLLIAHVTLCKYRGPWAPEKIHHRLGCEALVKRGCSSKQQWGRHVTANHCQSQLQNDIPFSAKIEEASCNNGLGLFFSGPTRLRRARSCGEGLGCERCCGLGCKSPAKNPVSSKPTLATGQDLMSSVPFHPSISWKEAEGVSSRIDISPNMVNDGEPFNTEDILSQKAFRTKI